MENDRIVVLGATGFVGSNIFNRLLKKNHNTIALVRNFKNWRLDERMRKKSKLISNQKIDALLDEFKPRLIVNSIANGGYSFQNNLHEMILSNIEITDTIANWALKNNSSIIHFGSSSEYGSNSHGPKENDRENPNSHYAVTKLAGTHILSKYAKQGLRSIVLRLYSVYGPKEDSSRLMPNIVKGILFNTWPKFTDLNVSRDFIYIEDVCNLIEILVNRIDEFDNFEIFNVGTGKKTTLRDLAQICQKYFNMPVVEIGYKSRDWDLVDWYANIDKAKKYLDWNPTTDIKSGLKKMKLWYEEFDNSKYLGSNFSESEKE